MKLLSLVVVGFFFSEVPFLLKSFSPSWGWYAPQTPWSAFYFLWFCGSSDTIEVLHGLNIQTFWPFFSRRGQGGPSGPPQSMPTIPQMAAPQPVPSSFVLTCCILLLLLEVVKRYQKVSETWDHIGRVWHSFFVICWAFTENLLVKVWLALHFETLSIRWMQNLIYEASLSQNFKRIDWWRMTDGCYIHVVAGKCNPGAARWLQPKKICTTLIKSDVAATLFGGTVKFVVHDHDSRCAGRADSSFDGTSCRRKFK